LYYEFLSLVGISLESEKDKKRRKIKARKNERSITNTA
jgi:hypothetical protein